MRKLMILMTVAGLLAFTGLVIAQDSDTELGTGTSWTCPEGFEGQTLSVYNWATYIGEHTIADFETLCGVTVIYDVYDTNESLIARLRQGNPGYDVAIPSDYAVLIMIRDGLVQQIDTDNIPNLANIAEDWLGLYFDPENAYSVPYLLGTFGVGYNVNNVAEPITSWNQVFEHDGPVAWINDSRAMMPIALMLMGEDPNSQDPDAIFAATTFLLERSANVVTLAGDDGQAMLARGEVDIALEYNGDMYQVIQECECDDYAYVVPDEGSIADIANLVLLTDSPNPELAQVFMDFVLDAFVGAEIANYTTYPTPNQASIDMELIDPELLNDPAVYVPEEDLENLFFIQDVGAAEEFYNDAFDELLILIGG